MLPKGNDEEYDSLIYRYKQGDNNALTEIYRRMEFLVYYFCHRFLEQKNLKATNYFFDAIYTEAFNSVLVAIKSYKRHSGNFVNLFWTIAYNKCNDVLKKQEKLYSEIVIAPDVIDGAYTAFHDVSNEEDERERIVSEIITANKELFTKEELIVYFLLISSKSVENISLISGINESKVYRVRKNLIEKIRKLLNIM